MPDPSLVGHTWSTIEAKTGFGARIHKAGNWRRKEGTNWIFEVDKLARFWLAFEAAENARKAS